MAEYDGDEVAIIPADDSMVAMISDSRSADTIIALKHTVDRIKTAIMQKDVHFGRIPGTPKDVLYQEGADVLGLTFKIAFAFENEEGGDGIEEVTYKSKCTATYQGEFLGDCEGNCSTNEDKYRWRKAVSDEEWSSTPEDRRRIKYYKNGTAKQVRTFPADQANTVLKMAQKRAKLGVIKTVLAIGDLFAIDIDGIPEENLQTGEEKKKEPKRKSADKKETKPKKAKAKKADKPPATSTNPDPDEAAEELHKGGFDDDDDGDDGGSDFTGRVTKIGVLKETDEWTMYLVKVGDFEMVTFDQSLYSVAVSAHNFEKDVEFSYEESQDPNRRPKLTAIREL